MYSMCNRAIHEAIKNKDLLIGPLNFDNIKASCIDLTLASTIDFFVQQSQLILYLFKRCPS